MSQTVVPITVVLPVLNEEANLRAALASVRWASEIFVVDSGSTDHTVQIAEDFGATVVQFDYPGYGPKKKAWALAALPFRHGWVLLLDADERVTLELRAEIEVAVKADRADGYYLDREFIFMGRSMRSFRPNWNMRLFRPENAHMEDLGLHDIPETGDNEIHEHIKVTGEVDFLNNALLHNDYRGMTPWIARHNKYATWEAHLYLKFRREPIGVGPLGFSKLNDFERKRVLRKIWVRLPSRPVLRFFIWYVLRGGYRDGRTGLIFCCFMSWYELLIGAKLSELESGSQRPSAPRAAAAP